MNHSSLLQSLLAIPQPALGPTTIMIGEDWNIPLYGKANLLTAVGQWHLYVFASLESRQTAARSVAQLASKWGVVPDCLRILRIQQDSR